MTSFFSATETIFTLKCRDSKNEFEPVPGQSKMSLDESTAEPARRLTDLPQDIFGLVCKPTCF